MNTIHRNIAALIKPILMVSALFGASLLAYGIQQQGTIEIAKRHEGGKTNPWRGLSGCIYNRNDNGYREYWNVTLSSEVACSDENSPVADNDYPTQTRDLLAAISPIIAEPASLLPIDKKRVAAPTTITTDDGKKIAKGQDVTLTLQPKKQSAAQALAACMTANTEACEYLGINNAAWNDRHENAAARMVGLVEIDMATGAIVAMASAHSPCYAAHWTKTTQPSNEPCPTLPTISKPQTWRLDNHARYTLAMPGSIDKPALMLALLRSPAGAALQVGSGKQWVLNTLKTSNSDALFDKLFCADTGFTPTCNRISGLATAAYDFGFNGGQIDLFNHQPSTALNVPNARLMMQKTANGSWDWLPTNMPDAAMLKQCSNNAWQKCAGEETAKIVSELWGQGNAQATALSAAQMIARLGAAANGQGIAPAHVLANIGIADVAPQAAKTGIERHHAKLITQGMALVARPGGTANTACVAVLGAATCNSINTVALKTGTPAFTHDRLTLDERFAVCEEAKGAITAAREAGEKPRTETTLEAARCNMQPYKWTVALVKDSNAPNAPFTRAIAVLAERNYRLNGQIDSAYDRGINVAAEVVFRYLDQTHNGNTGN